MTDLEFKIFWGRILLVTVLFFCWIGIMELRHRKKTRKEQEQYKKFLEERKEQARKQFILNINGIF